jgi:hypothetical protein
MTDIQFNLTEPEFNLVWNMMNTMRLQDEDDVKVWIELLHKMENKIEEINPNFTH